MTSAESPARPRTSRRAILVAAGLLAAVALIVDPVARAGLAGGGTMGLGVLDLRLVYNSGVAFSLGAQLPTAVIVAVTAAVTAGIGVFAWRTAPGSPRLQSIGLAMTVAGAAANVIDRILDGTVTDYFHTGWWPTFNLADVYITGGVLLVICALFLDTATIRKEPMS
ncbi:signal peptidase II [Tomitella biformata]|uniref:signal peptidase II n=1 Tax=Tomitella biformata TaxID=630403 RepID=UPI00046493B3|nr:signal peptidase II [Tomitella biformata]